VPLINVKVIEGVFDSEQKQQIVRSLTEAMVAIEGENMRSVTWCVVEEVDSGDWGIGGKPVTTSDVKASRPECRWADPSGAAWRVGRPSGSAGPPPAVAHGPAEHPPLSRPPAPVRGCPPTGGRHDRSTGLHPHT